MHLPFVRLVAALALAALPPTAFAESTIKRYVFSAQKAEDIRTELGKMKVRLSENWTAPPTGQPMRITGVGSSGFPTRFLVEQAGGGFHVYAERRRPQHPTAPLPYVTQEVVFDTPDPAVSDHLTRQGFAVLRYDQRGVRLTGGRRHPDSTTDDHANDALAAVRFLKIQPNVRASRIGIVGHSEGGIIASMVAAQAPADVRFIVMLGGTGLPGIDIKSLQDAAARRAEGMDESLVLLNQSQERELFEIAASDRTRLEALAAMRAATHALPAASKTALEIPPEGIPTKLSNPC